MLHYIIRRVLYAIPVLIGVNIITFSLFFLVNTPDDMARAHLGERHIDQRAIERWKQQYGYDKPLFYNQNEQGWQRFSQTLFFQKSIRLFTFHFGISDSGRNINYDISQRMWPSLAIAVPVMLLGLLINITFALTMAFFRGSYIDKSSVLLCIVLMSISSLFYIIGGQFLFGKLLRLVPISGYETGIHSVK